MTQKQKKWKKQRKRVTEYEREPRPKNSVIVNRFKNTSVRSEEATITSGIQLTSEVTVKTGFHYFLLMNSDVLL